MLKKHFTLLVSICTILSVGFAFINIVYNETYRLLVYDLKTGFTDNVSYAVSAAVLIVLIAILGGGYMENPVWQNTCHCDGYNKGQAVCCRDG